MVSESLGESALKAGAVVSALSTLPPIFLDDKSQPALTLVLGALLISTVLGFLAVGLTLVGSRTSETKTRSRYMVLTIAFICVACSLFVMDFMK